MQVSVAVLLDNFVSVSMRMENEEKKRAAREVKASSHFQSPLEPLVAKLAGEYTDGANLSSNLASLFKVRPRPSPLLVRGEIAERRAVTALRRPAAGLLRACDGGRQGRRGARGGARVRWGASDGGGARVMEVGRE